MTTRTVGAFSKVQLLEKTLMRALVFLASIFACTSCSSFVFGQANKEEKYYRITTFETPKGEVLEAGSFQMMPSGKLAVATRRGDVWMIQDPFSESVSAEKFSLYARGLHEPLGLAEKDGWLYATQRSDVTRMQDTNADGQAEKFEVVGDGWEISGDYHEYAIGSKFDKEGNIWTVLCLTGSFGSDVPFRGWCMRVTSDGRTIPTAYGIRSPGGIGFNANGDVFYTDNQGPWNGTCGLKQLIPGKFSGHPGGNRWFKEAKEFDGKKPSSPKDNSRIMVEASKLPDLVPPSVMFPYNKMGQSASGIACDTSNGKFGPFEGQLFVGDQTHSTIMRVDMEIVSGHYQGAVFPFRSGFQSGIVGVEMASRGSLFVGGTNRGWGSRGPKEFAVERLDWTGIVPLEIKNMRLTSNGFRLTFTLPVDPEQASKAENYTMDTFTYIYRSEYGSPEVDAAQAKVKKAIVSEDGLSVELVIDGLKEGHVHELHAKNISTKDQMPLLHPEAYYTLNYFPEK
jgi:glucose/arabinose dehydrogenase